MRCCSVLILVLLLLKEKYLHGWLQGRFFKRYLVSKSIGFERRLDVSSMSNIVVQSNHQIDDRYDETEVLAAAKSCLNHLEECEFNREWNGYLLKCKSVSNLTESDKGSIYKIFEDNMKKLYEANWGWKEIEKKRELFNPDSRFICVYKALKSEDSDISDTSGLKVNPMDCDLIAFVMFRFEWDDEDEPEHPVLFCYEIQVNSAHHKQQIGRHVSILSSVSTIYLISCHLQLDCSSVQQSNALIRAISTLS